MIKREIQLHEVTKIQEFNAKASQCSYDVDLQQGRYIIDAKSIMGIFSLDLYKTIILILNTEDMNELEKFKEYEINEKDGGKEDE